jgi:4-hydroxy-2-oxoheptanedioate aldolase
MISKLRQLWDSKQPMLGGWCAIPSPLVAEVLGLAGFDWVVIDTQHGLIGYQDLTVMLPALSSTGVPAIVRVPWNDPAAIMKALDAGAEGVLVPMVNSPDEARSATQACRFPPQGNRSWGPTRHRMRAPDYGPQRADRDVVCVVMIETVEAVERVEQILDVPGIDGVFVGPSDLAISAGLPPTASPTAPEHLRLIRSTLEACLKRDITAGIVCANVAMARQWRADGFRMLALPSDMALLSDAAEGMLRETRER